VTKSPWQRPARLALLAAGTVAFAAVLEIASRWLAPAGSPIQRRFPVELTRVPRPYTMFAGMPRVELNFGEYVARLNAGGYRGRSADAPRARGELRVFALGGSTLFLGEPSIPDLLEAELHRLGLEGATVFNYGVISSVSGQELARLLFEVVERDPDLIIFYNGGNDMISPALFDPRPGYPFNFAAYENNPLLSRDLASYPTLPLLAYGSNVARTLFGSYFIRSFVDLDRYRSAVGFGGPAWKQAIASIYVDRLVKAQKVSAAFGADFIAFFQPLVFFKRQLSPVESEIVRASGGLPPLTRELREMVRAELERRRSGSDLKAVDLSGLFESEQGEMFFDEIHTLPEGNRRVAAALAQHAASALRARAAKPMTGRP